jgi:hypothetical protein
MVREIFPGGFPADCGWAVSSDDEDDADESPAPEEYDADESPALDQNVDEKTVGPTDGVPLFASTSTDSLKRSHDDDVIHPSLKKARVGPVLHITVEPLRMIIKTCSQVDENTTSTGRVALDQRDLPAGCLDWNMAFNVAMGYVDCPLCIGHTVCRICEHTG